LCLKGTKKEKEEHDAYDNEHNMYMSHSQEL